MKEKERDAKREDERKVTERSGGSRQNNRSSTEMQKDESAGAEFEKVSPVYLSI